MSRSARMAYRARWVLLGLAVLSFLAGVWFMFWPEEWGGFFGIAENNETFTAIFFSVFFLFQYLFLLPHGNWQLHLSKKGRPMWLGIIVAGFGAGAINLCVAMALADATGIWYDLNHLGIQAWHFWMFVAMLWILWSILFLLFVRSRRKASQYSVLTAIIHRLLAGSVLQMFIAGPVFAFGKDPEDCFCARGSFLALILSTTVMIWCFGPGILLLFWYERVRQTIPDAICLTCDYDLRGTLAAGALTCPECGTAVTMSQITSHPEVADANQTPSG